MKGIRFEKLDTSNEKEVAEYENNRIRLENWLAHNTEPTFICEICHCKTPKSCEGSEPNTCAMCMPLYDTDFKG